MKKLFLTMAVITCLMVVSAGASLADEQAFGVTLSIPQSSGVVFVVTEILADGSWTDIHPTALDFGELDFDDEYGIFKPTKYFAIDIGVASGGSGVPNNIEFSYVDGATNPNMEAGNGRGGLGQKATLGVFKAYTTTTIVDGKPVVVKHDDPVHDVVLLNDVATIGTLDKINFAGGWPRAYVGIYDGADADEHVGWEVFTAEDAYGDYIGILTITAVVG